MVFISEGAFAPFFVNSFHFLSTKEAFGPIGHITACREMRSAHGSHIKMAIPAGVLQPRWFCCGPGNLGNKV